jgi:hypothetical protein
MSSAADTDGRLTLGELDRDEAILGGVANVYGESRARFLRGAVIGSAGLLAALRSPPAAMARRTDTEILNFDLVFEYLQSSFYLSALQVGTVKRMDAARERWARVLGAHEIAHVKILKKVLGQKATKKPFFDFHGVTESQSAFLRTAVAMEDLTVALLAGQAPRLQNPSLVAAVFSLLTVEARHAAWARRIVGVQPVGPAFDEPKSLAEVRRVVASTRFLAAAPKTRKQGRRPPYTG